MPDVIITPTSGIIDFYPGSTRVGRIDGSGNVINITNPSGYLVLSSSGLSINTSAPNATLHTYSSISGATILNIEGTNGSLFSVIDNLSGSLMSVNNNAGLPVFEVFSDDRVVAGRFGQNDLIITSGGNIGIGTGVPASKFHVVGTSTFTGDISSTGSIIAGSGSAANPSFEFVNDSDTGLFSPAANVLAISTSGTEKLRINNSGLIGIGTVSPTSQLHVIGTGNFTQALQVNGTGVSISGHIHTSSDISNFGSSVSGLLPSTIVYTTGTQTVNGPKTFGDASVFNSGLSSLRGVSISPNSLGVAVAINDASGTAFGVYRNSNLVFAIRNDGFFGAGQNITTIDTADFAVDNSGNINAGRWNATTIPINKGGTGRTSYSDGQLLIGSGTSLIVNTLSAGTGISITNGPGTITINTNGLQTTITNPITGTGTSGYISRFSSTSGLTNSILYDTGSRVGLNVASNPISILHISGQVSNFGSVFISGATSSNTILGYGNTDSSPFFSVTNADNSSSTFGWGMFYRGTEGDFRLSRKGGSTSWIDCLNIQRSNGFIGVGSGTQATAPPERLVIDGNLRLADNYTGSVGNKLQLFRGGGTANDYTLGKEGNHLAISTSNDSSTNRYTEFGYHSAGVWTPKTRVNNFTGAIGVNLTSTPSGVLDVGGDAYIRGTGNNLGTVYFKSTSASSDTSLRVRADTNGNLYLDASNASVKVGNQSADIDIYAGNGPVRIGHASAQTLANQSIIFRPASTEYMRLNGSGYLGIGTTTPSGHLDVAGDIYVRGTGNNLGTIYFKSQAAGDKTLYVGATNGGDLVMNGGGANIQLSSQGGYLNMLGMSTQIHIGHGYNAANTSQTIRFLPAATEMMRMTTSGTIGIGLPTTDTSYAGNSVKLFAGQPYANTRLHIAGSGANSSSAALIVTNSGSSPLLYARNDGNVGINTVTPSGQLHVVGTGIVSSRLNVGNLRIENNTLLNPNTGGTVTISSTNGVNISSKLNVTGDGVEPELKGTKINRLFGKFIFYPLYDLNNDLSNVPDIIEYMTIGFFTDSLFNNSSIDYFPSPSDPDNLGEIKILHNVDSTYIIYLSHNPTINGSFMTPNGSNFALYPGQSCMVQCIQDYNTSYYVWKIISCCSGAGGS